MRQYRIRKELTSYIIQGSFIRTTGWFRKKQTLNWGTLDKNHYPIGAHLQLERNPPPQPPPLRFFKSAEEALTYINENILKTKNQSEFTSYINVYINDGVASLQQSGIHETP
jgi:hypothetical protein